MTVTDIDPATGEPIQEPTKTEQFGEKLSEIACALAEEMVPPANLSEQCRDEAPIIPFDQKISAFKALTAYYAMIHKLPPPGDSNERGAFNEYRDKINPKGNQRTGSGRTGTGGNAVVPLAPLRSNFATPRPTGGTDNE